MTADSRVGLPRMAQAFDEVRRWREARQREAEARLAEVRGEQERLRADIAELQRQVQTLDELAARVSAEAAGLGEEERRRTRQAVQHGLQAEAEVIRRRDALLRQALDRREERVGALLAQPDIARLIEEYEQFQEAEATLSMLPEGYRRAILAHHETVKERLRPLMDAVQAPLAPHDGDTESITILASMSPSPSSVETLVVILPVPFAVFEEGSDRAEDLATAVAYRLVGVVSASLAQVGQPDAMMQYLDYQGLLALQVWFGEDRPRGDLRDAFTDQLDRAREQAAELHAAGVELYTAWMDPEVLSEAEDEADGQGRVDPVGGRAAQAEV